MTPQEGLAGRVLPVNERMDADPFRAGAIEGDQAQCITDHAVRRPAPPPRALKSDACEVVVDFPGLQDGDPDEVAAMETDALAVALLTDSVGSDDVLEMGLPRALPGHYRLGAVRNEDIDRVGAVEVLKVLLVVIRRITPVNGIQIAWGIQLFSRSAAAA